ncbi:hypothetical protein SSX86_028527 [Deinandra increscens subsp. villosa]|uniref:Uncharacterized protein n=1 Tax=Deinandra increscens subsp. villosa TaxID=3103831 RepID=A0AAP0GKX6_9ASTR
MAVNEWATYQHIIYNQAHHKQPSVFLDHKTIHSAYFSGHSSIEKYYRMNGIKNLIKIARKSQDMATVAFQDYKTHSTTKVEKARKLVKMARKWPKEYTKSSCNDRMANKGHFVVYTTDKIRFVMPLRYLNTKVFRELLSISEDEFGLPGGVEGLRPPGGSNHNGAGGGGDSVVVVAHGDGGAGDGGASDGGVIMAVGGRGDTAEAATVMTSATSGFGCVGRHRDGGVGCGDSRRHKGGGPVEEGGGRLGLSTEDHETE